MSFMEVTTGTCVTAGQKDPSPTMTGRITPQAFHTPIAPTLNFSKCLTGRFIVFTAGELIGETGLS